MAFFLIVVIMGLAVMVLVIGGDFRTSSKRGSKRSRGREGLEQTTAAGRTGIRWPPILAFAVVLTGLVSSCSGGGGASGGGPDLVGTWKAAFTEGGNQCQSADLAFNRTLEFRSDETVLFSDTNVLAHYSEPDANHIRITAPQGSLEWRFSLSGDILTLFASNSTCPYRRSS